jgi:hypothetical protein
VTPDDRGNPVALVSTPDAGVPSAGAAPNDVSDEAVTFDAKVVPVSVPAAAAPAAVHVIGELPPPPEVNTWPEVPAVVGRLKL